jgi:hypothetical protein
VIPEAQWRATGRVVARGRSPDGRPAVSDPVLATCGLVGISVRDRVLGFDAESLALRFSHPLAGEWALAASDSAIVVYTPSSIRLLYPDGTVKGVSLSSWDSTARGALGLPGGDLLLWSSQALRRVSATFSVRWKWSSSHWGDPCHDEELGHLPISAVTLGRQGEALVGIGNPGEPFQQVAAVDIATGVEVGHWRRPSREPWFPTYPVLLATDAGLLVAGIGLAECKPRGEWRWIDDDARAMGPLAEVKPWIAYAGGGGLLTLRDLSASASTVPARVELDAELRACASWGSGVLYAGTEHSLFGIDAEGQVFLHLNEVPADRLLAGPGWLLAVGGDGGLSRIE